MGGMNSRPLCPMSPLCTRAGHVRGKRGEKGAGGRRDPFQASKQVNGNKTLRTWRGSRSNLRKPGDRQFQ